MRPVGTSPTAVTDRVSGPFVFTVSPPRSGQEKSRDAAPKPAAKAASQLSVQSSGKARLKRKPAGSAPLAARSETFTPSALRAMEPGESSGRKWMRSTRASTVRTRSCPGFGVRQAASSLRPKPPAPAMGAKKRAMRLSSEGRCGIMGKCYSTLPLVGKDQGSGASNHPSECGADSPLLLEGEVAPEARVRGLQASPDSAYPLTLAFARPLPTGER